MFSSISLNCVHYQSRYYDSSDLDVELQLPTILFVKFEITKPQQLQKQIYDVN